jgi:hypothetical protein
MKLVIAILLTLSMASARALPAFGQDFKKWEAQTAESKRWLDSVGPNGRRYWIRLDTKHRPHRLYVGEGFFKADHKSREQFVETYSTYLAGHPQKYMLIDLFDAATNLPIGEFGWGGFKLNSESAQRAQNTEARTKR